MVVVAVAVVVVVVVVVHVVVVVELAVTRDLGRHENDEINQKTYHVFC